MPERTVQVVEDSIDGKPLPKGLFKLKRGAVPFMLLISAVG